MKAADVYFGIELATGYTIADYQRAEAEHDRYAISDFVHKRFTERYITPLLRKDKTAKHGFCMMAICCLMIEALESFWQGWQNTSGGGQGKRAFCLFFDRESGFAPFRGYAPDFYRGVRCGILHQAETTNGWLVRRDGPLFDSQMKIVNATKFHNTLVGALAHYCEALRTSDWHADIWVNLRKKMKSIISNCSAGDFYFSYGSNMDIERLSSRVASARFFHTGYVKGMQMLFNKLSKDGSGKANLIAMPKWNTWGVVFGIDPKDWKILDKAEGGYVRQGIKVWLGEACWICAQTYISEQIADEPVALESYKIHIITGAEHYRLPSDYLAYLRELPVVPDLGT